MPSEPAQDNPHERERSFLFERLLPLRAKDGNAAADAAPGRDSTMVEEPGHRFPPDLRRRLLEQHRRRQLAGARAAQEVLADEAEREQADGGRPVRRPSVYPVSWVPIGPSVVRQGQTPVRSPVSGRVRALAVGWGGRVVYAGSANGGVWGSPNGGRSWQPLTDELNFDPTIWDPDRVKSDSLSCGAIAIDPNDHRKIYVGTGEVPAGDYFGIGPLVSDDGGLHWRHEPTAPHSVTLDGSRFYALAVDPGDPELVVAATLEGLYRRERADVPGGF
jgi:hypothetical protein